MADREDFATAVGGLIKGRSPVGHTHDDRYARLALTPIPASTTDILTLPDGDWSEALDTAATTDRNFPPARNMAGWLQLRTNPAGTMRWAVYRNYRGDGTFWEARKFVDDWSPWVAYSRTDHTHDDRYYTETETDQKLALLAVARGIEIPTGADLNDYREPNNYHQSDSPGAAGADLNYPTSNAGSLTVHANFDGRLVTQTYREFLTSSPREWFRNLYVTSTSETWGPWQRRLHEGDVAPIATEHLMREADMKRRHHATVATPGVAVLIFDHGLTKFKADIWPLLQARGIPVTLALNPGLAGDPLNSGATWDDVKAWTATGLVEPANHSYNHTGGTAYAHEIRASREALETHLDQTIDTWVQPGNDFGDFDMRNVVPNPDPYWETEAGRLVLSSHGAVTGAISTRLHPVGLNVIGAAGTWIDDAGSTATRQTEIEQAITERKLKIVRFHPQFLNDPDKLTTAELVAFLDWVRGKIDAGDLTVLTFRDAMSAVRADSLADPVAYDSGLRDVSQYLNTGWSGALYARRVAGRVTFQFVDVKRTEAGGSTAVVQIPGFQPLGADQPAVGYLGDASTPAVMYRAQVTQYGTALAGIPVGAGLTGDMHFNTTRGIPSNPPGSAA